MQTIWVRHVAHIIVYILERQQRDRPTYRTLQHVFSVDLKRRYCLTWSKQEPEMYATRSVLCYERFSSPVAASMICMSNISVLFSLIKLHLRFKHLISNKLSWTRSHCLRIQLCFCTGLMFAPASCLSNKLPVTFLDAAVDGVQWSFSRIFLSPWGYIHHSITKFVVQGCSYMCSGCNLGDMT